jgi:hypothetical protein
MNDKIIYLFGIFLLILMISDISNATTPLDQLERTNNSRVLVDLNNLDPISATNIDQLHRELKKTERWQIADLGYYCSYSISAVQNYNDSKTDAISKFLNSDELLPESLGNTNLNFTDINNTNTIPYY